MFLLSPESGTLPAHQDPIRGFGKALSYEGNERMNVGRIGCFSLRFADRQ